MKSTIAKATTTINNAGGSTTISLIRRQILPEFIPVGARIVVRTYKIVQLGADASAQKIEYHDAIGHVISWDGATLHLMRDAAANGSRPEQEMFIDARTIVRLKPIPERKHRI